MTTYYVNPDSGSDGNAGTSTGAAWATTQHAADTAVAGDEVRLMATVAEVLTVTVDFDTNSGTDTSPIRFVGADASGDPLTTGHYVLDGDATASNVLAFGSNIFYVEFENVRFTNASSNGIDMPSPSTVHMTACRIDGHGASGVYFSNSNANLRCVDTEIDSNTEHGARQSTSSRGRIQMIGGSVHDNGDDGLELGADHLLQGTLVYDNGGYGIDGDDHVWASGCVFHGNGDSGIRIDNSGGLTCLSNCSFVGNGGYGVEFEDVDNAAALMSYNHTHSNTSGATNHTGGLPGVGNITGDPLFVSVTDGSEDYTPGSGSPLIGAGSNGGNIGAVAHAAGGGSGPSLAGIRRLGPRLGAS